MSSARPWALAGALALGGAAALLAGTRAGALAGDGATSDRRRAEQTPAQVAAELDALLAAAWEAEGLVPTGPAGDEEVVRRLYLDLVGTIPTAPQVERFLADRAPGKRERLVEELLATPGFARHMANRWADVLVGHGEADKRREFVAGIFRPWLERQLADRRPWGEVVTEMLTATGTVYESPPLNYLGRRDHDATDLAGAVSKAFLGVQIQCAQCHDHPYKAEWKQKDFWRVAAFFARVEPRNDQMRSSLGESERGEVRIPAPPGQQGELVEPRFITGESIDPDEGTFRRDELARILTSAKNPWFVRATVTRVWSFFFDATFTDPDDLSRPRHEELLSILERDFRASGYDMRRLCEVILRTRAYQLTSTGPADTKDAQVELYARSRLRPLLPEQLWNSFSLATDLATTLKAGTETEEAAAQQLAGLKARFFEVFARGLEDTALEQYTITQALNLLNGPLTNDALWVRPHNQLMKRLLSLSGDDAKVTTLFLRVLGRGATKAERKALAMKGFSSQEQAFFIQDVFWALMNSSEFVYNH